MGEVFMRLRKQIFSLAGAMLFLPTLMTGTLLPLEPLFASDGEYQREIEAEDIQGRVDWLRFRRTYPYSYLPKNARVNAWKAVTRRKPEPGVRWRLIGPQPISSEKGTVSGRINAIAVSPANKSLILIGSATGGIWRSQNGGRTFAPVSDNRADLAVGSIAFSKRRPNIIYAGMGDPIYGFLGHGVLKSTDRGKSWTKVNDSSLPSPSTIAKIEVDLEDPNSVYVAQHSRFGKDERSGFYVSRNGGITWSQTLQGEVCDLATNPADSKIIYAAIESGDSNGRLPGVYRTIDSGKAWQQILPLTEKRTTGSPVVFDSDSALYIKVATTAQKPDLIYAFVTGNVNKQVTNQLLVSIDSGKSWTARTVNSIDAVQPWWNLYIAADPHDANNIYVGALDIHKSSDGGVSWTNLTRNCTVLLGNPSKVTFTPGGGILHFDQHTLVFSPRESSAIYVSNDGGLFKSTDGGISYNSLNNTLSLAQFYSVAAHPSNDTLFYGGTQDNGTLTRTGTSYQWNRILGSDGGECVICPTNPSSLFATIASGSIFLLDNNGQSPPVEVKTFNERIGFNFPFLESNGTLYAGTYRLWVSTVGCDSLNSPNSWSTPGGEQDLTKGITKFGKDTLSAIGVCLSNPNVIYTGSEQGLVMVSTDGGKNWRKVENTSSGGLPDRSVTSINVDPKNPAIAFATLSGFGTRHVFKTTNTGVTWRDIAGNLHDLTGGDIAVNDLLIRDKNLLYIGTDIGVFMSKTGGDKWVSVRTGMPPVIVKAFAINSKGKVLAATFGRGVYVLEGEKR